MTCDAVIFQEATVKLDDAVHKLVSRANIETLNERLAQALAEANLSVGEFGHAKTPDRIIWAFSGVTISLSAEVGLVVTSRSQIVSNRVRDAVYPVLISQAEGVLKALLIKRVAEKTQIVEKPKRKGGAVLLKVKMPV